MRTLLSPLAVLLLVAPSTSLAADVSDMPPAFRGDLELGYQLGVESVGLVENTTNVGQMRSSEHLITYAPTFSFVRGAAAFLEIGHYPNATLSFTDTSQMRIDPGADQGTMIDGDPLADGVAETGSGFGGVWLGLRGSPVHQELFDHRGDRMSWVLELGMRFADQSNFYTYGQNGARGAGPGAGAWRLASSFSTTHYNTQPYLKINMVRAGRITQDVVDDSGSTLIKNALIRPASTFELTLGAEVQVAEYGEAEKTGQVSFDFRTLWGYRSWQSIPSGTFLPSVLDDSLGMMATESETAYLAGRVGLKWRFHELIELRVAGGAGTATGRRLEHFYPVSTEMGALTWGVSTSLRLRMRDWLVDSIGGGGSSAPSDDFEMLD